MTERNRLTNGRFLHNLNGWTVSGAAYSPGDGDDHYGVAAVEDGGYLWQDFAVVDTRVYSVHIAAKSTTGFTGSEIQLVINDGDGNNVVTEDIEAGTASWVENTFTYGLAPGTSYEFKIANDAGEEVLIDDVWVWHVPITRANAAARVDEKLAGLATAQSLSTAASGSKTEGDYTYAVDAGLRNVNAINPETGFPDVRYLGPDDVNPLLLEIRKEVLEQLQSTYLLQVDTQIGPRRESLSQIAKQIGDIAGTSGSGSGKSSGGTARVEQRPLKRY